jgi:hypothetical protein
VRLQGLDKLKTFIHIIESQTRDLLEECTGYIFRNEERQVQDEGAFAIYATSSICGHCAEQPLLFQMSDSHSDDYVTACITTEVHQRFGGTTCLYLQT